MKKKVISRYSRKRWTNLWIVFAICTVLFVGSQLYINSLNYKKYENTKYGFSFTYPSDKSLIFYCEASRQDCAKQDHNLRSTSMLGIVGGDSKSKTYFPTLIQVQDNRDHITANEFAEKYFKSNEDYRTGKVDIEVQQTNGNDVIYYYMLGSLYAYIFNGDFYISISPIDIDPDATFEQRDFVINLVNSFSFK